MEITNKNYELWKKIRDFQLDDKDASFKFSDKLAKEQGWSKFYTLRAIEEYKKFIFLICVTGNSCTPSEDVDQVWHMHLVYTKSYWNDFCKNTLGREIHHTPSKGGQRETSHFKFQYEETKILYENYFGETAPEDVWQTTEKRFQFHFRRVDLREYVLIPKLQISKSLKAGVLTVIGLFSFGCSGSGSGFSNFLLGIALVFAFIQLMGLIFFDSEQEQNGKKRELNRDLHSANDLAHTSDFPDIASVDVGGGDVGGCGGGCGGCGGCG